MNRTKRRQLFVDQKVQGALVLRAALYWVCSLVTMTLILISWRMLTGPARAIHTHLDDLWYQYAPAVVVSLVLLPIIVYDSVRMSNRFAGPMYRLRRCLRQLAAGERIQPIHFREGDFWHDFADDFNQLLARVEQLEAQAAKNASAEEEAVSGQPSAVSNT